MIFQIRGTVFYPISKQREVDLKKGGAAEYFLTTLRCWEIIG